MKKTYMHRKEDVKRDWHEYDLKGKVLGRAASDIARLLIGKNKVTYTPHVDGGDYVVAVNADKIEVTGKKMSDKLYQRHSGHPGGFKEETLSELMEKDPTRAITYAVKGMLPKNKLQDLRLKRLKVYAGSTHPHKNHFTEEKKAEKKDK